MLKFSIRPHHILCLRFFSGYGYSDEFTSHMSVIKSKLNYGSKVRLTACCDEICESCQHNSDGKCESAEKVKRYDDAMMTLCKLRYDSEYTFGFLSDLAKEKILDKQKLKIVCADCEWYGICNKQQ